MTCSLLPLLLTLAAAPATAAEPQTDLKQLSIQQLLEVEVVSPARKPEAVSQTAAAVFVITGDDIRRSGATSIAEALRLAPGVDVARLTSSQWAVGIRGFTGIFSQGKILVLIDGRTQNTTIFQGALWDTQDAFLEDIDRIEVVRGPGGALWGPDAVNGVINIITKDSRRTQGLLAYGGGGTQERGFGGARYGGQAGSDAYYRIYGKYFDRGPQPLASGSPGSDEWSQGRGGFRADWDRSPEDRLTFEGDAFRGSIGNSITEPNLAVPPLTKVVSGYERRSGADLQARWRHEYSFDSDFALQFYYDRVAAEKLGIVNASEDVVDLDFQRHFRWGERQDVVYGLGYRLYHDAAADLGTFSMNGGISNFYTAFAQDEVTLIEDTLRLTLGSKLEYNDFSDWEIQPDARLLWTPRQDRTTIWASVSRALRTPARNDRDLTFDFAAVPPGTIVRLVPNRALETEEVLAYELGYRARPSERLDLDAASFYDFYHDVDTLFPAGPASAGPPQVQPVTSVNARNAHSWGVELAPTWQALPWWRWRASYSFLVVTIPPDPFGVQTVGGDSPRNEVTAQSLMDLPAGLELDSDLRYVSSRPDRGIASYLTADLRLGWEPDKNWEVSVAGQNLASPRHFEWAPQFVLSQPTAVPRSVYGKVTCRF